MQAGAGAADLTGDQRQRDQAARIVGAVGVLRHAHAPEDDGVLGAREGAGDFTQRVRLDAADRRHLFRRELLDVLGEGREAFGVGLHILLVVEIFRHDDVEHRVQHRDVGAVLELHHAPGMALQRVAARIHHDELGATLGRLLEEGRRDWMILGWVGADHHDHVGILHLVEGGRHRRGADTFQQCRHRRGVAQPRAMIDIVGAEAGAHQLLEQIGLLVRAFRRTETGKPLGALFLADFQEALRRLVERLVPGRLAEMRPGIGRIDEFMRRFRHALLADHGLQDALRIVHVIEAEAALHAEPVLVRGPVLAVDVKELVVLDVVGELAADAAIGTNRIHLLVGIFGADVFGIDERGRHQRAGRAGLHAFAAGDAGAVAHRVVEIEHDLFVIAAAGHADHVVDLHFAAGADAEIALDAGVEIDRHRRMAAVGSGIFSRSGKRPVSIPILSAQVQNLEMGSCEVSRSRLVGHQKLEHHVARGLGAMVRGVDLHARRRACGCSLPPARARPRSRPCRRGNCRRRDSRARANSTDAGCRCLRAWRPARWSRRHAHAPRARRA